jgi:S1-C subfamily serine protease
MRVTAALLLLFSLAAIAARGDDGALAAARRATFVVQSCIDGQRAEIGSGVVVASSDGLLTIATAAHVIVPHQTLRILDLSRHAYYAVLDVRTYPDYDLAFIRVRAQAAFPVTPVPTAPAQNGEPVFVWGNPASAFWALASGSVLDTSAHLPGLFGSPRITISCDECAPGDSGAGVFDKQGRLIGILTHAWNKVGGGPVLFLELEPSALIAQEAAIVSSVPIAQK